jgi:hypothetical protein
MPFSTILAEILLAVFFVSDEYPSGLFEEGGGGGGRRGSTHATSTSSQQAPCFHFAIIQLHDAGTARWGVDLKMITTLLPWYPNPKLVVGRGGYQQGNVFSLSKRDGVHYLSFLLLIN